MVEKIRENTVSSLISAALEGGRILKKYLFTNALQIDTKSSPADLVTNIDLLVQERISHLLHISFPNATTIGEEQESVPKLEEVIYLDPLDGTLNYTHGFGQFAISLGYWIKNIPMAGVVYNPVTNDLFYSFNGQGAFWNEQPIHRSETKTLSQSLLATGWPYERENNRSVIDIILNFWQVSQEVRMIGCASLNLCYVAAGILDGYWEKGLDPWDMAGGVAIAREAGCSVSSFNRSEFQIEGKELLVSNGYLHGEMVKILKH